MFLTARHRLGLRTQETIMVGDTMETDIRGAVELGIQATLVLTGSARREDVIHYAYQPTRVVGSGQVLADELKATGEPEPEFAAVI